MRVGRPPPLIATARRVVHLLAALLGAAVVLMPVDGAVAHEETPDPAETIRAYYAASNARDLDGVLALFAEDFVFTGRTGAVVARGKAAWRAYLVDDVFAHGTRAEVHGLRVAGDTVTYVARIAADPLRQQGIAYSENALRGVVRAGRIESLAVVAATPVRAAPDGQPPTGAGTAGAAAPGGEVRVTLFHDTHIHGALHAPDGVTFAHYVGLIGQLRAALPAPGHSLFLGNGDDVAASPMALFAGGGQHVVDALNAARIDADTIGTDEFHLGAARLRELLAASRFPWVSANVREADTGEPFGHDLGVRPWLVTEVGGVRFGLTGAVAQDPPAVARAGEGVRILDPVEALRGVVPELRAAGAQVVVLLAHLCYADVERVATAVPGIDVAVGTHCTGEVLEQPRVVGGTIVSQRGHDLELLGQLDLTVRDGRVVGHAYRQHRLTAEGPVDPAVAAVLAAYHPREEAALAAPAGVTATALDAAPGVVRAGEAAAGNLLADALRAWGAADVGMLYAASVRARPQPLPAGPLTRRDVFEVVPAGTGAMVLRVTGAQLLAALENGVSRVEQRDARFPQASGLTFVYDPAAPPGARLRSAAVGGRPLAPAGRYTLATTNAMGTGLAGYEVLRSAEVVVPASEAPPLSVIVLDYLASRGAVAPAPEGRIQVAPAPGAAAPAPPPSRLPRTGDAASSPGWPLVVAGIGLLVGLDTPPPPCTPAAALVVTAVWRTPTVVVAGHRKRAADVRHGRRRPARWARRVRAAVHAAILQRHPIAPGGGGLVVGDAGRREDGRQGPPQRRGGAQRVQPPAHTQPRQPHFARCASVSTEARGTPRRVRRRPAPAPPNACGGGIDGPPVGTDLPRGGARPAGPGGQGFALPQPLDDDFDAIVGRLILCHLPEPAATLRALLPHLRSGGVVAFHDLDLTTDGMSLPPSPLHQQVLGWAKAALDYGGVEVAAETKLHRIFLDAGLDAPALPVYALMGGSRPFIEEYTGYVVDTVRTLLPLLVKGGIATEEEVGIETLADRYCAELVGQGSVIRGYLFMGGWARKP